MMRFGERYTERLFTPNERRYSGEDEAWRPS